MGGGVISMCVYYSRVGGNNSRRESVCKSDKRRGRSDWEFVCV